jgi:hypothetical protein
MNNNDKKIINNFNNKINRIEMNNPPSPAAAKESILFVGFN